ncbi:MAG: C1 family peptidase, partial [Anaerovoracaceae bacterium]
RYETTNADQYVSTFNASGSPKAGIAFQYIEGERLDIGTSESGGVFPMIRAFTDRETGGIIGYAPDSANDSGSGAGAPSLSKAGLTAKEQSKSENAGLTAKGQRETDKAELTAKGQRETDKAGLTAKDQSETDKAGLTAKEQSKSENAGLTAKGQRETDKAGLTAKGQREIGKLGGAAVEMQGTMAVDIHTEALPSRYDLRETGTLTPVKNQGNLGSCWAFAATASLENTLVRAGLNANDYPNGITLDQNQLTVKLGEQKGGQNGKQNAEPNGKQNTEETVRLKADVVGATNPTTTRVNYSYSGDLDSVEILTKAGFSGETTPLLIAKAPGTVTITATSDADINLTASCTLTITKEGQIIDPTNPDNPAQPADPSDPSNLAGSGSSGGSGTGIGSKNTKTGDIFGLEALAILALISAGLCVGLAERKRRLN